MNQQSKKLLADVFNWMYFMNNVYQEENPNPHVHWHVRPRYKNPVLFDGQEFTDPDFGKNYDRGLERVPGIEPGPKDWKSLVLPLNYTRIFVRRAIISKFVKSV